MRNALYTYLIILLMITAPSLEARADSKPKKPYGGTLIWGTHTQPTIINPILTTYSISAPLEELIFSRLVRINYIGEIEPDLAESWDISNGGLVYTFHLRKGVKFHDGIECTAFDVEFTYSNIIDSEVNSPFRSMFQLARDLKVIDKYTFQITLKKPSALFIYNLVREIAPKHILEKSNLRDCAFNFHPIGTGPFKFKEWTKDNQIILEANPDYYEGRPYLDKIITKTYPDSPSLWAALMRQEVDFVLYVEKEDYGVAKGDPVFKTYAIPVDYYCALVYNLNAPLFADQRIREAIAYAIDRKSLIEKVAAGYGLECVGPFYPGSLGFDPLIKSFEYDPQKAQALLADAGWEDRDKDGILEKDGEALEIRILVDDRKELWQRIAMFIRQQLQEVGIKIKVVPYTDDKIFTDVEFLKQNQPQAKIEFILSGIYPAFAKEDWHSAVHKRGNNLWIYKNEEVDRLFALGETAQDTDERGRIYQRIHQLIYADQPACFIYFPLTFHALSHKFENTDAFFTLSMPFYTIKDWYIKEKNERR